LDLGFVADPRVDGLRGPALAYRQTALRLARGGLEAVDRVQAYQRWPEGGLAAALTEPYPHQARALEAWWKCGGQGVVVLPTGAGKTFLAVLALLKVGRDALVVVPTIDLMAQWKRTLETFFCFHCGLIGGGSSTFGPVTIITYDSAIRRIDDLGNRFGLLVFDEVHHLGAPGYLAIAERSIAPFRLGLTATLERPDGSHQLILDRVGPLVFRAALADLGPEVLAPFKLRRLQIQLTPAERAEYERCRGVYVDFCRQQQVHPGGRHGFQQFLGQAMKSREGREAWRCWKVQRDIALMGQGKLAVLEHLLQQHATEKILIFTHVNELAYRISERHLIPVITHQTPPAERAEVLKGFSEGRFRAVVTSRVLNEGVDVPDASVAVVVSGSASGREHVQRLGRILRRGDPGKRAVLYELISADTHEMSVSARRRAGSDQPAVEVK
jgi:superfamily II DNA or RNA helicase